MMIPVACSARNVDFSECVSPGVCPGGSPDALPHTHPTMSGWIVADAGAADATIAARLTTRVARNFFTPRNSLLVHAYEASPPRPPAGCADDAGKRTDHHHGANGAPQSSSRPVAVV